MHRELAKGIMRYIRTVIIIIIIIITLKYTTLVHMRSSNSWTMKSWQRSEWRLGFNSVLFLFCIISKITSNFLKGYRVKRPQDQAICKHQPIYLYIRVFFFPKYIGRFRWLRITRALMMFNVLSLEIQKGSTSIQKSMAITPFWFSMEHHRTALMHLLVLSRRYLSFYGDSN